MSAAAFLNRFVRRPSILRALRDVRRSIGHLRDDLSNEIRHAGDLSNYCCGKTNLLLNVGCGDIIREEWVNIDHYPRSTSVFYFNAINPIPIETYTVSHIHAEHFLEHLQYWDAVSFIAECYRVLKIGGTMRIIVPDAEKYMRAYVYDDITFFGQLKNLGGTSEPLPTKGAICNQMFRMDGSHRFAWDFETLAHVIQQIGFRKIQKSCHNDSSSPHCIDGQDWWRPVESLYVNLIR